MSKKILVTGASGYIGKILIKRIVKKKNIKILATYCNNKPIFKSKNLDWFKLDISNKKFDLGKFSNIDYLVHLAWSSLDNFDDKRHLSIILPKHIYFLSRIIKLNNFKKIIIAGTCLEYGDKYQGKLSEELKSNPNINYAKAKFNLYKEVFKLKKKYRFKFDWLRIFYVYGYSGVRNTLWRQMNKKSSLTINYPNSIKDFIHVDEIVNNLYKLIFINKSYNIINVCSGKCWNLKRTINYWKKKYNLKIKVSFSNNNLKTGIYGDNKKIKSIK